MLHTATTYGLPPRHEQSSPIKLSLTPSHTQQLIQQSYTTQLYHNTTGRTQNNNNNTHGNKTHKQLFTLPNTTSVRDISAHSDTDCNDILSPVTPSTPVIAACNITYEDQCNAEVHSYSGESVHRIGSQSPTSTINIMMRDSGITSPTTQSQTNPPYKFNILGSGSNVTPTNTAVTATANSIDNVKFTLPTSRLLRTKSCHNTRRRSLKSNFDTATTDTESPTSASISYQHSLRSSPDSMVPSPLLVGSYTSTTSRNSSEPITRSLSDLTQHSVIDMLHNTDSFNAVSPLLSPLNNFMTSPRLLSGHSMSFSNVPKLQRSPCPSPSDNINVESYDSSSGNNRASPDTTDYLVGANMNLTRLPSPHLRRCESDISALKPVNNNIVMLDGVMLDGCNEINTVDQAVRQRSQSYISNIEPHTDSTQWNQQYNLFRSQTVARSASAFDSDIPVRTASSIDMRPDAQSIRSLKRHHIQLDIRSVTPRPRLQSHADRIEQVPIPLSTSNGTTPAYYKHKLPLTPTKLEGVNCVSVETVSELCDESKLAALGYDRVVFIDCRFPYEYAGGHLPNALNITDPCELESLFFSHPPTNGDRICIVFHCEYSQHRGPKCCKYFRTRDREIHGVAGFPHLFYPELYVMDGGYKKFHETIQNVITTYVPMNDKRYRTEWLLNWKQYRNSQKQGTKQQPISEQAKLLAQSKVTGPAISVTQSVDLSGMYSEPSTPLLDNTDDCSALTASQTDAFMLEHMDEISSNMWNDGINTDKKAKKLKRAQSSSVDVRSSHPSLSISSMLSPVVTSTSLVARTTLFNTHTGTPKHISRLPHSPINSKTLTFDEIESST